MIIKHLVLTSDGFGLYPKVAQQFWYYTLFQKIIKDVNFYFSKTLPLINYLWVLFQAEQQPQIWIPSCITSENEQEIVFFCIFFLNLKIQHAFFHAKQSGFSWKQKCMQFFFTNECKKNSSKMLVLLFLVVRKILVSILKNLFVHLFSRYRSKNIINISLKISSRKCTFLVQK